MKRIRGNLQIVIPLTFSLLERVDTVSTAMELHCFGKNKKRTWHTYQKFTTADLLTIAIAVSLVIISLWLFYLNQGRFYNPWH